MTTVWDEVGADCFRRRYESFDLNIGVVRGGDGFLVVDTRCHATEANELLADLRQLGTKPVRRIVNTHWHFDHCWGNATVRAEYPDAEIWGHERLAAAQQAHGGYTLARLRRDKPEWSRELDTLQIVPPDQLVTDEATIDLGDRGVDLRHPGRGHTDNDIVVVVSDAPVVFAGDIVEESAPPSYGDDSYPLEWPSGNERLLDWIAVDATVVPGHGDVVDRAFVSEQTEALHGIAATIRRLFDAGVPAADALDAADWPYPREYLREAVARGYAVLRYS